MIRLWGAKFQGNDAIKIAKVTVANASRAVHPMVCNTELRARADCRLEAVKLPHLPWSQMWLYKLIEPDVAVQANNKSLHNHPLALVLPIVRMRHARGVECTALRVKSVI
jgi:hypothetical protein